MSHSNAGRYGKTGSSPITPAGRVVYNAKRDIIEIEKRKNSLNRGSSAITGKQDDEIWVMQRWNPVMALRINHVETDTDMLSEWVITDCANGLGTKGAKRWQLNAALKPAGFIGTNADYDSKANDDIQGNHAPIQVGGLANVPNYGPKTIRAGDHVLLSAPDPRNQKPVQSRHDHPKEKIHWWTLPYDPRDQAMSKQAAYDIIRNLLAKNSSTQFPKTNGQRAQSRIIANNSTNFQNIMNFSTALFSSIRIIAMVGVITALESGLVVPVTKDDISNTQKTWMGDSNQDKREKMYEELAGYFGVVEKGIKCSEAIQIPKRGSEGGNHSMCALLHELVFSSSQYKVFPVQQEGGIKGVFREKGEINQAVNNVMETLLASMADAQYETLRFVVGQAMSTAKPGDNFDIKLGNFMING